MQTLKSLLTGKATVGFLVGIATLVAGYGAHQAYWDHRAASAYREAMGQHADEAKTKSLEDLILNDHKLLHQLVALENQRAEQVKRQQQAQQQLMAAPRPPAPSANAVTAPPTITGGQTPVPEKK